MPRLLALMLMPALLAVEAGSVAAQAPNAAPPAMDVPGRIAALKAKAGSDAWDEEVEKILLAAYDKDKSGEIDSEDELAAIPCEVWQTLDKSIRAGAKDANLIESYGFAPGTDWEGDALGIDEALRKASLARIQACGVSARQG